MSRRSRERRQEQALAHTLDREGRADRVVEEGERKARDQKLVPQMGQRERLRSAVADTWLTLPCLSLSLSLSLCRSLFFSVPSLPRVSLRTGQTLGAPFFFFLFPFSLFPFPCQPPPPRDHHPLLSSPTPIPLPTYLCPPSLNGLLRNRVVLVVLVLVTCNTPESRREKRNLSTKSSHTPSTK